jgi:lipopolysaccharide/colanic/teichoic acid biosynthesis glycosyltransferase
VPERITARADLVDEPLRDSALGPVLNGAYVSAPHQTESGFDNRPLHRSGVKRAFDVVGALVLLLVLLPLMLGVAAFVRLGSPGPVLFRQARLGAEGREFMMLKFRSMRADAEEVLRADSSLHARYLENACKLPADEDPRLTRVGRFIRATSLDELPQLWNVVKGDMSLVGPRPVLPGQQTAASYRRARPGVTGAWQVAGRSALDYDERLRLDEEYVRQWSIGRDLAILARTPKAVVTGDGAY